MVATPSLTHIPVEIRQAQNKLSTTFTASTSTLWKFKKFPAIKILREINFGIRLNHNLETFKGVKITLF